MEPTDDQEMPVIRFKGLKLPIYPECRIVFPPYGKILEILNDFKPDVVHIVTEVGIGYAGLRAARELHLPIVMSYHTNYDKYLNFYGLGYLSKPIWTYVKWFHNFASVNLCPSRNTLSELLKLGFRNLDIWTRGIDMQLFSPDNFSSRLRHELGGRDKTIFLYVGRIAREKGLDTLAESIKIVNKTHEDQILYVFTGDGPYKEELENMGFPNAVFTGPLRGKKLAEIYASSDAFVFPSGSETFGNVMLEAMASGLPGICTNAGGVTDFTHHGENALVYRNGDARDLANAQLTMLNEDIRNIIRIGALQTASQRDWNHIFDGLFGVYKKSADTNITVYQIAAS